MLQAICEALNLESSVPAVKRKAPYIGLLVDVHVKALLKVTYSQHDLYFHDSPNNNFAFAFC